MDDKRAAVAAVFDRAAATYDAVGVDFFSTVGRTLVEDADVQRGERVLDLGCGRGAVLFPAAERVGPAGQVTGVDIAPSMVTLTANDIEERGLQHVSVQLMDVQEPDLPSMSYDLVTASLVVFFLPDPPAALTAWHQLLVPGGRLAMTTFTEGDDERWSWLGGVFAVEKEAPIPQPYDEGPLKSTDGVHRMLGAAGYATYRSTVRPMTLRFDSPEQWLDWSWSTGLRAQWERLSNQRREVAQEEARRHLTEMQDSGALTLEMGIRYTVAHRDP